MITQDRLNRVVERLEALKGYLDIERKLLQIAEDEKHTQDPDFWNDPKQAERVMKQIRNKKTASNKTATLIQSTTEPRCMQPI